MLFPDDDSTSAGRSRGFVVLVAGVVVVAAAGGAFWLWYGASRVAEPVAPAARGASSAAERPKAPESPASAARPASGVGSTRAARAAKPTGASAAESTPTAVTSGVLRVQSDVPGASVFLDRTFLGTTPLEKTGLSAGSHRVNVSAEGYEGVAQSVEIGDAPAELTVRFKEVRLDAAVPVVHKHAVGSCDGRLVATVQGLALRNGQQRRRLQRAVRTPPGVRGRLPEEEPARASRGRQDLQLHRSGGQRRCALRLPPRRREGPGPPGGVVTLRPGGPSCSIPARGRFIFGRPRLRRWPGPDPEHAKRPPGRAVLRPSGQVLLEGRRQGARRARPRSAPRAARFR